jgi:hypothetical protein
VTETAQVGHGLRVSVTSAFAALGSYLALITRNNPHGSLRQLFARPDVSAEFSSTLEEARDLAMQAVEDAWYGQGGPRGHQVLDHLLHDVERAYSPRLLRTMVRTAFLSVPTGQFIPGVSVPGSNPAMESAQARAQAVQDTVSAFASRALYRNSLTIDVAAGHARTEAQIADAPPGSYKRWRAHVGSPVCCHWCRMLDGVTIPVRESFLSHLAPAADLTGHGHLTQPPHPYKNRLPGPRLHPHCQCWLEIVAGPEAESVPPEGGQVAPNAPGYLSASEIRAMPEENYGSLVTFLRASAHELGQLLRRLVRRGN